MCDSVSLPVSKSVVRAVQRPLEAVFEQVLKVKKGQMEQDFTTIHQQNLQHNLLNYGDPHLKRR